MKTPADQHGFNFITGGSSTSKQFLEDDATRGREYLKRTAKERGNSRYDEGFVVDYVGTRSKYQKVSNLNLRGQYSSSLNNSTSKQGAKNSLAKLTESAGCQQSVGKQHVKKRELKQLDKTSHCNLLGAI